MIEEMGRKRALDYKHVLELDPAALHYVPEDAMTQELCAGAVIRNIQVLRYVPECMMGHEFYAKLFREGDFSAFPKELLTEEICLEGVDADGWNLKEVPERFRTAAVCQKALDSCRREENSVQIQNTHAGEQVLRIDMHVPMAFKDVCNIPLSYEDMKKVEEQNRAKDRDGHASRCDSMPEPVEQGPGERDAPAGDGGNRLNTEGLSNLGTVVSKQ